MRRLFLVCVLLSAFLPASGAYADNGRVKRPPTQLWNAYPLVQTPDPVIATPTRTSATATPQAEEVASGSGSPFSPSQPSVALTVAVLTIVASSVAAFAFMTLQTAGRSAGRHAAGPRRRRRPDYVEALEPAPESEDDGAEPTTETPVEAVLEHPPEKELATEDREVEVLRAKRRELGADDHAALVAKLKR